MGAHTTLTRIGQCVPWVASQASASLEASVSQFFHYVWARIVSYVVGGGFVLTVLTLLFRRAYHYCKLHHIRNSCPGHVDLIREMGLSIERYSDLNNPETAANVFRTAIDELLGRFTWVGAGHEHARPLVHYGQTLLEAIRNEHIISRSYRKKLMKTLAQSILLQPSVYHPQSCCCELWFGRYLDEEELRRDSILTQVGDRWLDTVLPNRYSELSRSIHARPGAHRLQDTLRRQYSQLLKQKTPFDLEHRDLATYHQPIEIQRPSNNTIGWKPFAWNTYWNHLGVDPRRLFWRGRWERVNQHGVGILPKCGRIRSILMKPQDGSVTLITYFLFR
eukprot:gb/GECG01007420.1/.p1 GENE.gb/GECG01007420.1/~~gb/GECG01007420.1/.p1  ORF type:complete len:334 (+),score=2.59 gb/GECG01007420.1/:1-1002(+)